MSQHVTRRRFLEDSMIAATAAMAAGSATRVLAGEKKKASGPGERLSVAVVGVNGRGNSHISAWLKNPETEITYVCDVDEAVGQSKAESIGKKQGRAPKYVRDLRELLEDKSVDFVSIATPNHWHALQSIWSIQAGKDVYCEKPVSHNVSEGRRIVDAARKYNRICQTGTQCRSMGGTIAAIEYVRAGKIGEMKLARGLCYKRRKSIGERGTYAVPDSVDYNLWCGPAPMDPLTRPKLHYDWHWQWAAGNGDLGNQGIHQMDIARWGLGETALSSRVFSYGGRLGYTDAGDTANTQVVVHDFDSGNRLVFEVRGLETESYRGANVGVVFHGSEGYVVLTGYDSGAAYDRDGKLIEKFGGNTDGDVHFTNFIEAVRSRKASDLNADIEEGHLSSALCHTGNISYLLGQQVSLGEARSRLQEETEETKETFERTLEHLAENEVPADSTEISYGRKLVMNPQSETFQSDSQADSMLTRDYRAPFVVPAAGQV